MGFLVGVLFMSVITIGLRTSQDNPTKDLFSGKWTITFVANCSHISHRSHDFYIRQPCNLHKLREGVLDNLFSRRYRCVSVPIQDA